MGVTLWNSHFTGDAFDAVQVNIVPRVSLIPNKRQHRQENEFAVLEKEEARASRAFHYTAFLCALN